MARRVAGGADNIGQELFRTRIAMQDVILRAFLIVEDELHRDPRPTRPARVRRLPCVTSQIARIVFLVLSHLLPLLKWI